MESAADVLAELGLEPGEAEQLTLPVESLSDSERKIVALLSLDPVHVDEIIEKCDLPAPMGRTSLSGDEGRGQASSRQRLRQGSVSLSAFLALTA